MMKFDIDTPYFSLYWIPTKFYYEMYPDGTDEIKKPCFRVKFNKFVWDKQKGWRDIRKMPVTVRGSA